MPTSYQVSNQKRDVSLSGDAAINFFGGNVSLSGISVTPDSSLTYSAVYACVAIIANNLSTVPWTTFERKKDKNIQALNHPAFYLLKSEPHPHYSSTNFRKSLIANALLNGNGYARIYRDGFTGKVIQLQLRQSGEISPFKDSSGELWYYDYKTSEVVPHYDMIHIAPLGFDGISGKSPITLARESIGSALAEIKTGSTFWKNGARLDGYVTFPNVLTEEGDERIRKSWKSTYGGPSNAGKTLFLEQGGEYKKINMSMQDAQYIESKKFNIEDVARWFHVPLHKIGHLEKSSFNNIEQQAIEFVENCLRPWAVTIEQEFDRKLFMFDKKSYFTRFELKGLLRGDIKTRTEHYRKLLDAGVYSINDVLKLEDRNPVEGGDNRFIMINRLPLDKMDEYAEGIINKNAK